MIELKEVLRQWLAGVPKKRIAARLGMDPKTVRSDVTAAEQTGLALGQPPDTRTDDVVAALFARLRPAAQRPHGDAWAACEA